MRENRYQAGLIKRLKELFPGCVVVKNDSSYMQGIPDLTVFVGDRWAMLEIKKDAKARSQPNQEYYVNLFNEMAFAAIIDPSNEEDVLNELQRAFGLVG